MWLHEQIDMRGSAEEEHAFYLEEQAFVEGEYSDVKVEFLAGEEEVEVEEAMDGGFYEEEEESK